MLTLLISEDVPITITSSTVSLDAYLGSGKLSEEEELPEEASKAPELQYNAAAMAQLEGMGFPTMRCQKALLATGNADPETAMNWLFQHMEDPGEHTNPNDLFSRLHVYSNFRYR